MSDETPDQMLAAMSRWIDTSSTYQGRDPELVLMRRLAKITEERGEAWRAQFGLVGENPRKGVTHTQDDLIGEVLDVAVAALGAVEHITGNQGNSIGLLYDKIRAVCYRAGLLPLDGPTHSSEQVTRSDGTRVTVNHYWIPPGSTARATFACGHAGEVREWRTIEEDEPHTYHDAMRPLRRKKMLAVCPVERTTRPVYEVHVQIPQKGDH